MLDPFLRLLFWIALFCGAARIGAWVTGSRLRGIAHLAWDGLAGLPVVMAAWLALGLLRFDRLSVVAAASVSAAVVAYRVRTDPVARFRDSRPDRPAWIAGALLAVVAIAGLAWNRVPVLFYDSLAYHFAQPELWLIEGRIAPYEWSLHSWFPPGMSVLYGVGLALGGEPWANDANLLLGVALGLAIFDLGRRCWDPWAGLIALLALLAVPQILFALAIPAADLAHGAFVAAALAALLLSHTGDVDDRWGRRAAWIAAGAVLTKYLGLMVPLAAGTLFCALNASRGTRFARRLASAVRFALPSLLLLLPWLIANGFVVGNPVAPMFASSLPIDGLAPGGELAFARDARGGLPGWADVQALVPRLFGPPAGGIYPGPAWGWPLALWILAAVSASAFERKVRLAVTIGASLFALWFVMFRWERFLIATVFFVCLAFAGAAWSTARKSRARRLLAAAAILLAWAYVPVTLNTIAKYSGGADVFLARETPQSMLHRSWPQQRLIESADLEWGRDDRLLLLGEMRHFRLPVRRTAPSGFNVHPFAVELERSVTVEQIHLGLRRRGFTHLSVDRDWIQRSSEQYPSLRGLTDAPDKFRAYVDSLGPPLATDGSLSLFRIPESP